MMRQRMLHILLAGTFGALAAAGSVQAIAPAQGNVSDNATQTDTQQGPSSAANESGSAKAQNAGDAMQSQSDEGATNKMEGSQTDKMDGTQSKNVPKKHPPTSVMDRATPDEKTPDEQSAPKHPPTNAMDRETPEQKSPGATASESGRASGGSNKTD